MGVCKDGGQSHQMNVEARSEEQREVKRRENGKGQCELSKLAVLLDKRKEREGEKRWRPRPRARGGGPEHLWCSQGKEKRDCHRGSNAIGDWGVDVEGRGAQTKQEASASSVAVLGTNL